jgi:hypothetical protein
MSNGEIVAIWALSSFPVVLFLEIVIFCAIASVRKQLSEDLDEAAD